MKREYQKEKNGDNVSSPNEALRSTLFRGGLDSAHYKVYLYKEGGGYSGESVTLKVDEFAGTGQVDHEIYIVHNSHGTDSDSTCSYGPVMTLAQTADLIQAICNQDTESGFTHLYPEGNTGIYYPELPALISKLRQADRTRAAILQAGKAVVDAYMPAYTVKGVCYASVTSVVLDCTSPKDEDCVIKLNCVPKEETVIERLFCKDPSFSENGGLVPIWMLKRIPLDATADILLTVMPRLNSIRMKTMYSAGDAPRSRFNLSLTVRDMMLCGKQVALGLQSLHKRGLIHNDIKPENIFYKKTGAQTIWYLGDWDSLIEERQLHPGNTVRLHNTSAYAAPEVRRREPFSYSSDIYSWGITMLALHFNVVPHGTPTEEITRTKENYYFCGERFPSYMCSFLENAVIGFLYNVVLQKNPSKRCTASEFLRELEHLELINQKRNEERELRQKEPIKTTTAGKAPTAEGKNGSMAAPAQQEERSSSDKTSNNTRDNALLEFLLPKKFVMMLIGLIIFIVIVAIVAKVL